MDQMSPFHPLHGRCSGGPSFPSSWGLLLYGGFSLGAGMTLAPLLSPCSYPRTGLSRAILDKVGTGMRVEGQTSRSRITIPGGPMADASPGSASSMFSKILGYKYSLAFRLCFSPPRLFSSNRI
ncbi:hypothetical protein BJX61DRAFT_42257 [Aspergillus egyptiacus]|nr:hypothetical protein BJX61DRAFT_42257 [Aspergillus egyptiacus]